MARAAAGKTAPQPNAAAHSVDLRAQDVRRSGAVLDSAHGADSHTPTPIEILPSSAAACAQDQEKFSKVQTRPRGDASSQPSHMGDAMRLPHGNKPAAIAIAALTDGPVAGSDDECRMPKRSQQPTSTLPSDSPTTSTGMPSPPSAQQPASRAHHGAGMLKRLTTKLRSPTHASDTSAPSATHTRKMTPRLPSMPKAPRPTTLTNSFVSPEQRQAALRARGLIPAVPHPYKDAHGYMVPLSEQERELDRRRAVLASEPRERHSDSSGDSEEESEAKKIREAWLVRNRPDIVHAQERGSLDHGFAFPSRDNYRINTSVSPSRATFVGMHDTPLLTPSRAECEVYPVDSIPEELQMVAHAPALLEQEDADRERRGVPGSANTGKELPAPPSSVSIDPQSPDVAVPRPAVRVLTPPRSVSSDMTQKVSRWLDESSKSPTPISVLSFESSSGAEQTSSINVHAMTVANTPRGTPLKRRDKPAPIIITMPSQPPSPSSSVKSCSSPAPAITLSVSRSDPLRTQDPHSLTPQPTSARGRSATVAHLPSSAAPPLSSPSPSSGSQNRSKTTTLPALSPTRTVSSSGASASVTTPTTLSHSLENHHHSRTRPFDLGVQQRSGAEKKFDATVIVESPIEDDGSGCLPDFAASSPLLAPQHTLTADKERRKSITLGMFGKKPHVNNDLMPPRAPRPSKSMLSLRKFSSKLQFRPKQTVRISTSTLDVSASSNTAPTSSVPPQTSCPPSAYGRKDRSRTVGVGLRPARPKDMLSPPRQALSPTMHDRATILLEAGRIQDEESRRLSEMAFLDY